MSFPTHLNLNSYKQIPLEINDEFEDSETKSWEMLMDQIINTASTDNVPLIKETKELMAKSIEETKKMAQIRYGIRVQAGDCHVQ